MSRKPSYTSWIHRRLPGQVREARERDDLYGETNLCLVVRTFTRLAADEPARARAELAEVMGRWSHDGFHVQHAESDQARRVQPRRPGADLGGCCQLGVGQPALGVVEQDVE